jgi:hypothetical protein
VSAQLRDAAGTLWQLDEGDRQLSKAQRMNLRTARSSLLVMFVVLGAVLVPLMFLAGGCVTLFATSDTFEPFSVILILCGILPFALGFTAAFLALRHVRRRGRGLEDRCAALPPAGAGLPARCHVCGGPLSVGTKQGVVRCAFCRADNLVSDSILAHMAARRSQAVGQIGEQVRNEARALDSSALAAGGFALLVAVLSPFVAIALVVVAVIIGSSIEREAKPNASYTFVPVTNTNCVAEVLPSKEGGEVLSFYTADAGFVERPIAPGTARLKSSQLVGREYALSDGRQGTLRRVYRDIISTSIDRGELDVNGSSAMRALSGMCEITKSRRSIVRDPRLSNATRMHVDGDALLVSVGAEILRVPKAGGALSSLVTTPSPYVSDFMPSAQGLLVQQPGDAAGAVLNRYPENGGKPSELVRGMISFSLDGDGVLVGKQDGLYRLDASGGSERLADTQYVAAITTTPEAIYWASSGAEIHERLRSNGQMRKLGKVYQVLDLARVGSHVFVVDKTVGVCSLPLTGGEYTIHAARGFTKNTVRTDGARAYFGLESSSRGGVAGLTSGTRSLSEQHYGIDTETTRAFAVDGGQVFWVSGSELLVEPVPP